MYFPIRISTYSSGWRKFESEPRTYEEAKTKLDWLPDKWKDYYYETNWVSGNDLKTLAKYDVGFEIERDELTSSTGAMIVKLQNKIEALKEGYMNTEEAATVGAVTQIAIPDLGLMTVREVQVIENCCTDMLQDALNEGWRLLAVCPPNSQRRPDYVMGRSK